MSAGWWTKLGRRIRCTLGDHEWTCAAEQGIQPTAAQSAAGVLGFMDYAQGYCRHCSAKLARP